MRNCKWCRVRLSSVLSSSYWSLRILYNFISNAELLREHTSAFHRILSWHQEMMKRDQEKHKMYFPSLCLENFYFYGLGCLHPRRPRGQVVGARESLKVARYSFSRPIPPKFEHKIRCHKQSFGKIATTIVLNKDENLLWSWLQWHRSCHSNEMTQLPILLTKLFLGTGNCSSKIIQGSFFLQ